MRFLAVVFFLISSTFLHAQVKLQLQTGYGYTEHFSVGVGCTFSNRHVVTLLYGSNFLVQPQEFSTYMIQYNFVLPQWKFADLSPTFGIKGGQVFFTDTYYTWEVAAFIPFVGIQYPLHQKIELVAHAGAAISFEQKVQRLNYGEIGHYRDILPELKVGLVFHLKK